MATKTILLNLDYTNIRSNPSIIQPTDHSDVDRAIINAAFPGRIDLTTSSTSFLVLSGTLWSEMKVRARKVNGRVYLDGVIKSLPNVPLAMDVPIGAFDNTFASGEYEPDTPDYMTAPLGIYFVGHAFDGYKRNALTVYVQRNSVQPDGALWITGGVTPATEYTFSINYQAVD